MCTIAMVPDRTMRAHDNHSIDKGHQYGPPAQKVFVEQHKNGARNKTFNQLKNGSQFFRVLKTFSLEKNSVSICFAEGLTNAPSSSFQQ